MSGRVPYIVEKIADSGERAYDLYSRLLMDRVVFISGMFDQGMADDVVAQLLYLEMNDPDKDIHLYINSPGGHVDSMFAIYDTMTYIKPDVATVGYGTVASAASFILAAGAKDKRFALPNTQIMMHQPSGGINGQASDIKIQAELILKIQDKMVKYMSSFTGQKESKVRKDMDRDFYMSAKEAKDYGIIDSVQEKR